MKPVAAMCLVTLSGSVLAPAVPVAGQGVPPNTLTAEESAEGWQLLFDGHTMRGWRGFRQQRVPEGWQALDGSITRVARAGDLITTEQFENFALQLEWMVEPGGNSGVFFRVTETPTRLWEHAPEMQVLDDERHPDGRSRLTSAGADYGLHPAAEGAVKPAGQWNAARILVRGDHVEYWLNGVKTVGYEIGSADWQERVRNSKFVEYPEYGLARRGHIGLQDHGDRVYFRNIKILRLP